MRPMKAEDWDCAKQRYPVIAMPKIDGVRALNVSGTLYGRSMKKHANKYITETLSRPWLEGFDGELAAAEPTHPRLPNLTTSAVNTIEGSPEFTWWIFDLYLPNEDLATAPYAERLSNIEIAINDAVSHYPELKGRLRPVPFIVVNNENELREIESQWLGEGYEGVILRDPNGVYKQGRSTVKEGGFLRIKAFVIEEAFIYKITEGVVNNNTAKKNELGYTERSSHKENLIPNGQVGSLQGVCLKTGKLITIGPGKMAHKERAHYWQNPHELIGQVVKYKHFPKGVKDKPRFPTFELIRAASDLDPILLSLTNQLKQAHGL